MSGSLSNSQDLRTFNEIREILSQRSEYYGDVLAKFFIGNNGDGWRNAITTFTILPKDFMPKIEEMDYSNIIYTEKIIKQNEFIKSLDKLTTESRLSVSERLDVEIKERFEPNSYLAYVQSNDKFFNLEWPSNFFQFRLDNSSVNIPFGPYVSLNHPLYPNYTTLMEDKFNINSAHYHQFFGSVLIFLPNYKAKITGMKLGAKMLVMSTKKNISDDLIAKVFLQDSEHMEKPEIKITDSEAIIPLSFVPIQIQVYLLSTKTGENLDYRRIHLNWPAPSEELDIEMANEDILQLISRGESDRTEFKQEINKSTDRFVQSVVAFANTNGGTIFIGVNDDGEILGSYDQKLEETIQNTIRSNCEPTIKLEIENRIIDDKKIVVVSVMEGKDKPYSYRGKGFFVRRGSTNRIATRFEVDEFYKAKQNNASRVAFN